MQSSFVGHFDVLVEGFGADLYDNFLLVFILLIVHLILHIPLVIMYFNKEYKNMREKISKEIIVIH
jgi:hypothetical protein